MTETIMNLAIKFRILIYIAAFAAIVVKAELVLQAHEQEKVRDEQAFWPPDLIPHPHPPYDPPSGEPEMG